MRILFAAAPAWAAVAMPAHAGDAGFRPAEWAFSQDGGFTPGRASAALTLEGASQGLGRWETKAPMAPTPGAAYRFSCRVRGESEGEITVFSGLGMASHELKMPLDRDGRTRAVLFRAPRSFSPDEARARVGLYNGRAKAAFSEIRLERIEPVYAVHGGMAMGPGESVDGLVYRANGNWWDAAVLSRFVEEAPPISQYWFTLDPERPLVLRHELAGRRFLDATAKAWTWMYHNAQVVVSVSLDGETWREAGAFTGENAETLALPADLFPAERLWVRYAARPVEPERPARARVSHYVFTATLDGEPARTGGDAVYVTLDREAPGIETAFTHFGPAPEGMVVRAHVANRGAREYAADAALELRRDGAVLAAQTFPGEPLPPGGERTLDLVLPHGHAAAGPAEFVFALGRRARARADVRISPLYDGSFGERLDTADGHILWTAASAWKVGRARPAPEKEGTCLFLAAARDEAESVQLVLRPARGLAGVRVDAGDLASDAGDILPAAACEARRFAYLDLDAATDALGAVDAWPDPLLPQADAGDTLAGGMNHPYMLTVKVPKGQPTGVYRGVVRVAGDGYAATVPLTVRVFGFALPPTASVVCNAGFTLSNVHAMHRLDQAAPEEKERVERAYWELLRDTRVSIPWPAQGARLDIVWPELADDFAGGDAPPVVVDGSGWDRAIDDAIDRYGNNSFCAPVNMGFGAGSNWAPPRAGKWTFGTPQFEALTRDYLGQLERHFRGKGWLDRSFTYVWDEPAESDYPHVISVHETIRRFAPGLRRMLTEAFHPDLAGHVDIWCPIADAYLRNRAAHQERRQSGEAVWWYFCSYPKAPHAATHLDHSGIDMRIIFWNTWLEKLDGVLFWSCNSWGDPADYRHPERNPWRKQDTLDVVNASWANGDGRFVYPPAAAVDPGGTGPVLDGPVPTQRLYMLRDGVEDFEYFAMLKRLLDAKENALPPRERAALRRLLLVDPAVTTGLRHFAADPTALLRQREALGEAIERLTRLP